MGIGENIARVRERIARAAARSGRDAGGVELVAVSKFKPVSDIMDAYRAGQLVFGENHAQELRDKIPQLPADIRWHYIGMLQTNKLKYLVGKTTLIQSVDSARQLEQMEKLSAAAGVTAEFLVQVSPVGEPQKGGISPDRAEAFLREAGALPHVKARGLMMVPPLENDPETNRPLFRELYRLYEALRPAYPAFAHLSMGMSADFEIAVEEGANMVRVGTDIFGAR
ncbi:MAG: YggS family pyridoxal phosphate-dependent enzyme [Lachnospiraceae bacterium]|jgi:pyridoxal phosphate enzyme (YggS family)|nr:YggS family pyridoxal phosphate-dependent enzyme [Lachnospiraceae bacterium]